MFLRLLCIISNLYLMSTRQNQFYSEEPIIPVYIFLLGCCLEDVNVHGLCAGSSFNNLTST